MSDATPNKIAPEAVTLRAQPRSVTRLNRRTLAALVGGLSIAVLGATLWSLQPQRRGNGEQIELYNVDRVSKSEGLDALPTDYSKLPPPEVPMLGLTRRLGVCHRQRTATRCRRLYSPRIRPQRCTAQRSRSGGSILGVLPHE